VAVLVGCGIVVMGDAGLSFSRNQSGSGVVVPPVWCGDEMTG